jgi:hypothetical protein
MGERMWITGDSLIDLTSKLPDDENVCSENEQITEQTAAFKIDVILENNEANVSHEIM